MPLRWPNPEKDITVLPADAVDICAEFGVDPNVADNSVPINNALAALSPLGLRGVITIPGNYGILNPIVIGNGSSPEEKTATQSGVLEGVGNPGWLNQFVSSGRTQITWRGAAGGVMVAVTGPVGGWALRKLLLHGNGKAKTPLLISTGQFGQLEDFYTLETFTGIICRSTAAFKTIVTNCQHNVYRRVGISFNGFPEPEASTRNAGILLTSEGRVDSNCCFEDWEHVWINVPKSSVGNQLSAIHIGGSDSCWFRDIHPLYVAGGTDPQFSVTFDYNDGNAGWPESALIEGIDIIKNPRNIGVPAVAPNTAPNIISAISGANAGVTTDPKLPNLSWVNPRVQVADRQQGQPGGIAPSETGWFFANQVMVAKQAYISRFVPDRDMASPNLVFNVTTAATVNDALELGIYNGAGERIFASGEKFQANTPGRKSIATTANLTRGETYYIAIAYGTVGGVAATIQMANFNATNNSGLFGAATPKVKAMQQANAFPLPANLAGAAANAIGAVIVVEA